MKPQEAIEFYKKFLILKPANEYKEAAECSIKALEKEIPKKPIAIFATVAGKKRRVSSSCPNCKSKYLGNNEYIFDRCEYCGQALDWNGEK